MTEEKKQNKKWIWMLALLLFIGVAATTIAVLDRFDGYLMSDEGAISLTPEEEGTAADTEAGYDTIYKEGIVPGFEAESDGKIWNTETNIELFHINYEDGEYNVSVESADGEKIIAPGTENSFVFKLKNTGNVAMDYDVQVEAFFEPKDTIIPIQGRISRYDGEWVSGAEEEFIDITDVKKMQDSATLGAGRYLYYTLDWVWPFEQGTDELDTMLGNATLKEEITFTVCIKSIATISSNPGAAIGIQAPDTGDQQAVLLWIALGAAAIALFVILFFFKKKEQDEEEDDSAEAEVTAVEKE